MIVVCEVGGQFGMRPRLEEVVDKIDFVSLPIFTINARTMYISRRSQSENRGIDNGSTGGLELERPMDGDYPVYGKLVWERVRGGNRVDNEAVNSYRFLAEIEQWQLV